VQAISNRSSRRVGPFWTRHGNASPCEADEVRNKIESKAEASKYRELNLRALRGRHDSLVKAICRCTVDAPCAEILCSRCARRYRLWLGSELTHLAAHGPPAFTVTILLEAAQGPALSKIEPRVLHARVRKRLMRAGIPAAIGGTEASYRSEEDTRRFNLDQHLAGLWPFKVDLHDFERLPSLEGHRGAGLHAKLLMDNLMFDRTCRQIQKLRTKHNPMPPRSAPELLAARAVSQVHMDDISTVFAERVAASATPSAWTPSSRLTGTAVEPETTSANADHWAMYALLQRSTKKAFASALTTPSLVAFDTFLSSKFPAYRSPFDPRISIRRS
jgi:hypothetical protein